MRVDLYTDASIKQGRGTWAAIILRDGIMLDEASGVLRGRFQSSAATEIAAIANGVHHGVRASLIERGDEVIAWCDNMAAVMWANAQCKVKASSDPVLLNARRCIRGFRKSKGFTFEARHIKGHQRLDSDDPCAIYNLRCDQLCAAHRDGTQAPAFVFLVDRIANAHRLKAKREESST